MLPSFSSSFILRLFHQSLKDTTTRFVYLAFRIPSRALSYRVQVDRVVGVLDRVLANQKYLVGDKLSIADLIYVVHNRGVGRVLEGSKVDFTKYKNFERWNDEMIARPAVKKCLAQREGYLAEAANAAK